MGGAGAQEPAALPMPKQVAERRVWRLKRGLTAPGGSLIRTLEDHTSWVSDVAVTPDGRRAVSASWDRTLRLWDLENRKIATVR